jgi:hypothetical protein
MPHSAKAYERAAGECVRLASLTEDPALKRGLLQLRHICLETARRLLEQARVDGAIGIAHLRDAIAKQILKLRWMGMEEDACELQLAVRSLLPEQAAISLCPVGTD